MQPPKIPIGWIALFSAIIVFGFIGTILLQAVPLMRLATPSVVPASIYPESKPEIITTPQPRPVVIRFFGDIMLGRNVEVWVNKTDNPRYPFEHIRPAFDGADLLVANLEGPILEQHIPTLTGSVRFNFATSSAQALVDEGFDMLSMANNHDLDYGPDGFANTREWLTGHGIQPFGHPQFASDEYIAIRQVRDRQLILFGFNAYPNGYSDDKIALVASTTQANLDAFAVVFMHWGDEYQLRSNLKQQEFARELIDAGADLIIGAHPHVVQEVEEYQGKAIFYSLGNFIFDQYFSNDTQQGLAVELRLDGATATYRLLPMQSIASQPQLMEGTGLEKFLTDLAKRGTAAWVAQGSSGM